MDTSLRRYYDVLFSANGPQHWWPGRTAFEIIVGAILTQNTSWSNVEIAMRNLRREKLLTPGAIERASLPRLAKLIRSSGYFRQKAKKLKCFVCFLRSEYGGSLNRMFRSPTAVLREKLLTVHGIGLETADAILLYAAKHQCSWWTLTRGVCWRDMGWPSRRTVMKKSANFLNAAFRATCRCIMNSTP